jgi:hypothetical protein
MKCFERELKARWPQFTLFDSEPDTRIWSWKLSPHLVLFVMVHAFRREDQFSVEVAWSETEEFPYGAVGQVKVDQPQGREGLGLLWESDPHPLHPPSPARVEHVWDAAPEKTAGILQDLDALREGKAMSFPPDPPLAQTLPRVLPLVRDAVDKLEEYGMGLFRRVAEVRGVDWPGASTAAHG